MACTPYLKANAHSVAVCSKTKTNQINWVEQGNLCMQCFFLPVHRHGTKGTIL